MRVDCPCGATIKDGTDDLSHKGHVIPDQEWFGVFDALDAQVVEPLDAGRLDARAARPLLRHLIGRPTLLAYQCRDCGRLYLLGREGKELHCFVPEGEPTGREVLRGRPSMK